eukprot:4559462-Pyramimonas_sp.AAC.1
MRGTALTCECDVSIMADRISLAELKRELIKLCANLSKGPHRRNSSPSPHSKQGLRQPPLAASPAPATPVAARTRCGLLRKLAQRSPAAGELAGGAGRRLRTHSPQAPPGGGGAWG